MLGLELASTTVFSVLQYYIACAAESNTLLNPLLVGSPNSKCWGNKLKTHHRHHYILQFSVNQFPSVVSLFAVMCFWLMIPASEAGVTKTWCRSWYLDPPSVSSRSRMQWRIFQNHISIFSFMILKLMTYEPFNFQLVHSFLFFSPAFWNWLISRFKSTKKYWLVFHMHKIKV